MKRFKEVEATRKAYHADAALNSVHRSSLLVPEIPGSAAEISFLNHFLIKRNYQNVACRITAIDPEGARIESRLHKIDEPRVYTIPLTGAISDNVATYLIEFFAAENLFIPFPAVMVNHRGDGFLNTVHAFNRVLNDVFEDDAVNQTVNAEASIDVVCRDDTDTILYFMAGSQHCKGAVDMQLTANGKTSEARVPVDAPRFCHQALSLRDAFKGHASDGGVLKVRQPSQFMFYGRMLVAARLPDGSFAGNHSYYDSSDVEDYWDDARPSERMYPFFGDFENAVRMYPIMSPGELNVAVTCFGKDGSSLGQADAGVLKSPGDTYLDISIDSIADDHGIPRDEISAFAVRAAPGSGNTPTRVNHQLVYGDRSRRSPLAASVNVSLDNPNIFQPEGKKGLTWGQVSVGGGISSVLGIVRNVTSAPGGPVELTLWGESGKLISKSLDLPPSTAAHVDLEKTLSGTLSAGPDSPATNVWFEIRTQSPGVSAFVASRHVETGHCTSEHSF